MNKTVKPYDKLPVDIHHKTRKNTKDVTQIYQGLTIGHLARRMDLIEKKNWYYHKLERIMKNDAEEFHDSLRSVLQNRELNIALIET